MDSTSSDYIQSLPPDVKQRYESKTAVIGCDPYSIVVGDFNRDVTKWPQVGFLDIRNYLISSPSAYTSVQLKKYKSLNAYKYYQDGWIRQILHTKLEGLHLIRAKEKLFTCVIIVERSLAMSRARGYRDSVHVTALWLGPGCGVGRAFSTVEYLSKTNCYYQCSVCIKLK